MHRRLHSPTKSRSPRLGYHQEEQMQLFSENKPLRKVRNFQQFNILRLVGIPKIFERFLEWGQRRSSLRLWDHRRHRKLFFHSSTFLLINFLVNNQHSFFKKNLKQYLIWPDLKGFLTLSNLFNGQKFHNR